MTPISHPQGDGRSLLQAVPFTVQIRACLRQTNGQRPNDAGCSVAGRQNGYERSVRANEGIGLDLIETHVKGVLLLEIQKQAAPCLLYKIDPANHA